MKILFSSNIAWSIYSFRSGLLSQLQKDEYQIYTLSKEDAYAKKLSALGFQFSNININNNSKNPVKDLLLVFQYLKMYRKIKPDIILHNAIKPDIYGTIAAGILGIPVVNNISGLGTLFIKQSFSTRIAKSLYKFSQKFATIVFFQNLHDKSLFLQSKLVNPKKTRLIPGSGVNTQVFHPKYNTNQKNAAFEFLMIARLINDKGLQEYLSAAKLLKVKYHDKMVFSLLGPFYTANETAITPNELKTWQDAGTINYLGETDLVAQEIAHADCIVLPSYREGLSKVLIEASAMGKPIVTTNVPGCKDVVEDGYNGFLCRAKDVKDLADKMEKMYLLDRQSLNKMGQNARQKALDIFDEQKIINIYKSAIQDALKK